MFNILALWFLQQVPTPTAYEPLSHLPEMGVGGAIAAAMFYFYRQDRKAAEQNLAELGKEFKEVVVNNTEAMTKLTTMLQLEKRG